MSRLTSYNCTCILGICQQKQKYTAYLASVFEVIKVNFNYAYWFSFYSLSMAIKYNTKFPTM